MASKWKSRFVLLSSAHILGWSLKFVWTLGVIEHITGVHEPVNWYFDFGLTAILCLIGIIYGIKEEFMDG